MALSLDSFSTLIFYGFSVLVIGFITYYIRWRMKETSFPFNAYTTAEQAINNEDLSNKTALVTGCNAGIGKETVRVLVKQGCNVIMACRNEEKATKARSDILKDVGLGEDTKQLTIMQLDLSSLENIKQFSDKINAQKICIDYLINNAGVAGFPKYTTSKDGFEMQFATNHLGHFYLTHLLMPNMVSKEMKDKRNDSSWMPRVINLASAAENLYPCKNFDKINDLFDTNIKENDYMGSLKSDIYSPIGAYSLSKSYNILFTRELSKRYGNKLIAVSLHPGAITSTELGRHMDLRAILDFVKNFFALGAVAVLTSSLDEMKNIQQGAATTIRCVSMSDDEIVNGGYYVNCRLGDYRLKGIVSKDKKRELQSKLWKLSESLIQSKGFAI